MTYGDHLPGEIAQERDWQRRMFMDASVGVFIELRVASRYRKIYTLITL